MNFSLNFRRSAFYLAGTVLALVANSERANADVIGPGEFIATVALSGTFGPGQTNAFSPLFKWQDRLFATPGINDPGDRILITVVVAGSNPTLFNGGTFQVNSRGVLDATALQNTLSSEILFPDPQFTTQTITYSMPLYGLGMPADGNLTEFWVGLQAIASLNVISGSTTGFTASDFSAAIRSIRAVDAQGNDITSQIGLRSASGFMGTSAPEPGTFVLMAGGLILLPLVNTSFRKRLFSRSL